MTRLSRWEWALPALLAAWTFVPLALLLGDGRPLTGADGIIAADQLQYLAWVRDAANHGPAGNLFDVPAGPRDFVHPMFTPSGGLVALGLSVQLAYLLWKPVALLVLGAGAFAWARRLLPGRPRAQAAAATLGLLFFSPLAAFALLTRTSTGTARDQLLSTGSELFAAGALWGYLPTVLAIALMPLTILAVERGLERPRRLAVAAGLGALVSWLHPWQGITLLLVVAGLAAFPGQEPRRRLALALPAAGLLVPLAYYGVLARTDRAWELSSRVTEVGHPPLWVLLGVLLPLAVPAVYGLRRPGEDLAERALLLWIAAGLATYAFVPPTPAHALAGLALPLGVLAVRGWERLRAPAALGAAALAVMVVPGAAAVARELRAAAHRPTQQLWLADGEAAALRYVRDRAPGGDVLASFPLATAVPAHTGRAVWVGHLSWSPDFTARARRTQALFDGHLAVAPARALVREAGVRLLVAGCARTADVGRLLGPAVTAVRRFECATVYEIGP